MEQLEAARAEVHEIVNRFFDKYVEYIKANPEDYKTVTTDDFVDYAAEWMFG